MNGRDYALRCALALLVLPPAGRAQAVVEGTVPLPPLSPLSPAVARYATPTVRPKASEPPSAVVFLEGSFPATPSASPTNVAVMIQHGLQFFPALLPVRVGTAVEFPNHDDLYHNVFSYSKPRRFDLGRYRKDERAPAQVFDKPGVVKLNCEIHEHMRAVILVLETPHFTRTGTNGQFRLEGLPAGRFRLKAWRSERDVQEREVELRPGETLRVNFNPP